MANNRMYLKCEVCGGQIMLGKRMAVGYYCAPHHDRLESFFDEHDKCATVGGYRPDPFVLDYEVGREGSDDETGKAPSTS